MFSAQGLAIPRINAPVGPALAVEWASTFLTSRYCDCQVAPDNYDSQSVNVGLQVSVLKKGFSMRLGEAT